MSKFKIMFSCALLLLLQTSTATESSTQVAGGKSQCAAQQQQPTTNETIRWQVVSSGAANSGTSANFKVSGTAGQTCAGPGLSANFGINQGFWQSYLAGAKYTCGDADGNGAISIGDAVFIINYIFGGGPAPNPLVAGDADCSSNVSIGDAVYLINFIFGGGPAPCASC